MTISSTTVKNSYSGNGSLATFNYTFKIFANTDLQVIIRSSTATETVKTLTTHYTVTGAGNANGGTVVFTSGNIPANGETVVIRRAIPQTQAIDYIANDPFPAESHEEGLDRATMAVQQLQEEVNRSIKLSRTNTMNSTEFSIGSTDRAGKIFGFDSNGELVVSQELGTFKGNWSAGTTYAARDIVKDTSTNNIFLANTGHTSSGSQPLTTNTDSAKWDLLVDAASATSASSTATAQATIATTKAGEASTSASTALSHKNDAETAKTAAETAQTASETARNAAQTAQAAAETALDTFDDRFLGAKSSDPSVDNDGNALVDGALYFDTANDVMKVYDLSNTQWRQLALTGTNQTNVNTVAGQISPTNNIATLAGLNTQISNLGGLTTEITNLNNIRTDISGVNSIAANVTAVKNNETNINSVHNNSANINTLAGISGLSTLASNNANITTAVNNLSSINNFAEVYRIASSAPTSSLNIGDLYFDTTANELKVYKSSGWSAAGSTVNGTSQRFTYNITSAVSSVSGTDANGNTLAYDAGFADVYVNGVRMSSADITITSGTSVVFASALSNGDVVDVVAYGTFNVASINASNITAGTINNDRLPSPTLVVKGDGSSAEGQIQLNCAQNSHGVKIKSPAHSAGQSYTLILPTSVGSSGQVLASNGSNTNQLSWVDAVEAKPTVANVSQTIAPATATTISITGTGFVSIPQVEFVKTDGSVTVANTVSFTNATTLSVNVTLASGNYFVRVENPDGNAGRSTNNILTASTAPSFTTAAGSLGTFAGNFSGTLFTLQGSSDSAITFAETTSNLSGANVTLSSAGVLATTDFGGSSTTPTQYNFNVRITDAEGQTADRSFSITSSFGATGGGQFN
jgi:hypothetical protein